MNSSPKSSNGEPSISRASSCGTFDSRLHAVEDIREAALDRRHGVRRRVDRNLSLLPEIERPHVVEPHDVVGVRVREDHGVEVIDASPAAPGSESRAWCRSGRCGRRSCTSTEGRRRLSRGSSDVQTAQWQPIVGTPTLVPEPEHRNLEPEASPFRLSASSPYRPPPRPARSGSAAR